MQSGKSHKKNAPRQSHVDFFSSIVIRQTSEYQLINIFFYSEFSTMDHLSYEKFFDVIIKNYQQPTTDDQQNKHS
jgi:hypothetical protein